MAAVHVGLELEHISAKGSCDGIDFNFGSIWTVGQTRMRAGRQMDKGIEKGLHAKIGQRRGKKDRGHFSLPENLLAKRIAGKFQKISSSTIFHSSQARSFLLLPGC